MKKRHLILGCSAAGIGTMTKLRKLAPHDEIICLTAQSEMPYNTCLLADYLSEGTPPATIWTKPESFFADNNITLHRNHRVIQLDPAEQRVHCDNGSSFSYDTLFIGTGTRARHLPTDHTALSGLFNFQTMQDTNNIDSFLQTKQPETALIIGAGLSGIECADALVERGLRVTLAEYGTHLLPTLINKKAHHAIAAHLSGTTFVPECRVKLITVDDEGCTTGALLNNGSHIAADMVVVAIGAIANNEFAAEAGLTLEQDGILVNNNLQTSIPNIFAGGDIATVPLRTGEGHHRNGTHRNGTWPDAMQQGMFAAANMAGQTKQYPGLMPVLSSHFYGTKFVSCGPVVAPPEQYQQIEHAGDGWYQLFLLENNRLKGFLLIDRLEQVGTLRRFVTTQEELSSDLVGRHSGL